MADMNLINLKTKEDEKEENFKSTLVYAEKGDSDLK